MKKIFWYDNCSNCNQGRLIITEDVTHHRLYLHCEECERGWLTPDDAHDAHKGFLTLLEDFETENPNSETIMRYGWEKVAKHEFLVP